MCCHSFNMGMMCCAQALCMLQEIYGFLKGLPSTPWLASLCLWRTISSMTAGSLSAWGVESLISRLRTHLAASGSAWDPDACISVWNSRLHTWTKVAKRTSLVRPSQLLLKTSLRPVDWKPSYGPWPTASAWCWRVHKLDWIRIMPSCKDEANLRQRDSKCLWKKNWNDNRWVEMSLQFFIAGLGWFGTTPATCLGVSYRTVQVLSLSEIRKWSFQLRFQ